jgi:hypothetical protein
MMVTVKLTGKDLEDVFEYYIESLGRKGMVVKEVWANGYTKVEELEARLDMPEEEDKDKE